jgi:hypothetical protein
LTTPIPQNDPVDGALDRAGAVRQAQAVDHGRQIAPEPGRKGAQLRQLIALHLGDPVLEAIAVPASHEFGERGDMAGERLQVWAAGQHLLALALLVGVQAVGVAQQP